MRTQVPDLKKLDELTPRSKAEAMEEEIDKLKSAIKLHSHSQEITELKKAQ